MAFQAAVKDLQEYGIFRHISTDFFVNDLVFTSPTERSIPQPIPPYEPLPHPFTPSSLIRSRWAHDDYPYIAYFYRTPFVGPLMSRFMSVSKASLQTNSAAQWHLPAEVGKEWKIFDQLLHATADKLLTLLKSKHPAIECTWVVPQRPTHYGYFNTHPSQDEAFAAMGNSINAFAVYFGYITFLVGLFQACHLGWSPFDLGSLLKEAGLKLHPTWAQELQESGVGQQTSDRHRVGVFVDVPKCRWRNLIPYMIKLNIPLWFHWGAPPFVDVSGFWAYLYRPNPTIRRPGQPPPPLPNIPSGFPPVVPNSGQKPGEAMEAFFARRARNNEEQAAKENPQIKQRRLDRSATNGKKLCPGQKGPRTFQWVDVDGFRIRQPVSRKEVEDIWYDYPLRQIKYDSFHNEFDICSDFEDGDDMADRYDSDDEQTILPLTMAPRPPSPPRTPSRPPSPLRSPPRPPSPVPPPPRPSIQTQILSPAPPPPFVASPQHVPQASPPPHPVPTADPPPDDALFDASKQDVLVRNPIRAIVEPPPEDQYVEDIVYYRYGFSFSGASYQKLENIKLGIKTWVSACRAVGGQHLEFSSKANQQPIMDFINVLASSSRPLETIPADCWDLNPLNLDTLGKHECRNLRLEVKTFGEEVLCFLHPVGLKPNECPMWILAVSPMTALECIRRELGPDPYTLVEYFVAHGMAFRTLQRSATRPPETQPGSTSTLGKRPHDYRFDTADFAKYLTTRDTYLESQSNARRALSVGGIIARLAREVLPVSVVLAGPSQDALDGKQDVLVCGDEVFVDDGLPETVKRMLCGSYTEDRNAGGIGQVGQFSWFPLEHSWDTSGFNVGHWTEECEHWYRRHLQTILDGTFSPAKTTKWRNILKLTGSAPKLLHRNNDAALQFLQSPSSSCLR